MSRIWWLWRCLSWRKEKGREFLKGSGSGLVPDAGLQVGHTARVVVTACEALRCWGGKGLQVGEFEAENGHGGPENVGL